MNKKRVFIVNPNQEYIGMFKRRGWEISDSLRFCDLVQFTGGADVSPLLYHENNEHSFVDVNRDLVDISFFCKALAAGRPMSGICRGGQFLNVMAGGKMEQHVIGHATGEEHEALDLTGVMHDLPIMVTSTHHQMMLPSPDGRVLMKASIVGENDTEAVFYRHIQALCFQPHPEFFYASKDCTDLYFIYLENLLGGEL